MPIRNYQPGDEEAQARIYNAAAGHLPRFKPATAEEIARRYRGGDSLASTRFYAIEDGETVGYATFDSSGRIGYPWCLPGREDARESLLDSVLSTMKSHDLAKAWAAYRRDWRDVLEFFFERGFVVEREMINYVGELSALPHASVPTGQVIEDLQRVDLLELLGLSHGLFEEADPGRLGAFLWENPYFGGDSVFALKRADNLGVLGVALLVRRDGYANPTMLDAAMPCFRLGAFGTERQRHKRVDGMFSCVFQGEEDGVTLLAEAVRRLESVGLTHIAAQAPGYRPDLPGFYDQYLTRQGTFPILARPLADG